MTATPLMPKATAVWLVENTSMSFEQIAEFCHLHPLEVKAIADGEAALTIKGLDPVLTGQLTREDIDQAQKDPNHRLHMADSQVRVPVAKRRGPRYTPVSRRQDRPNAILWLLRNHPELKDAQIMRLVGTTKPTIEFDPRPHPLERQQPVAARSGDPRPLLADRPRFRGREGGEDDAASRAGRSRKGRRCCRPPTTIAPREAPRRRPPREVEREAEREADAVFAKLKSMKGRDEDEDAA